LVLIIIIDYRKNKYRKRKIKIISNKKYIFDIYIYVSNELNFNKIKEYFNDKTFMNPLSAQGMIIISYILNSYYLL